jgi:hypothetical protein
MKMKSLIISMALGGLLAACGGTTEELADDTQQPQLGDIEQGICEGWDSGARHCTFKCTSTDYRHWYGYGDVAYGQCTDVARRDCGREPYSVCWSKP